MRYHRSRSQFTTPETGNARSITGHGYSSNEIPKACGTFVLACAAWLCMAYRPCGPVSAAAISIPGSTATVTGAIYVPVQNDLFDVAQGATIVSSSPTFGSADGLLGGAGFFEGTNNTLFADGASAGRTHSVVFRLASPAMVNAISIGFSQDGSLTRRGAAAYSLLGLQSPSDTGVVLSAATFAEDYEAAYGFANIAVQDQFPTFTGQFFRLDLVQRTDYFGPRVQELDGFAVAVPEPSAYAMAVAGLACGGLACAGLATSTDSRVTLSKSACPRCTRPRIASPRGGMRSGNGYHRAAARRRIARSSAIVGILGPSR
jgi:hypothetical protein